MRCRAHRDGRSCDLVARRRRANEELALLTSWDAFRAPSADAETGANEVQNVEGNAMDGTQEVEEELELDLE